MKKIILRFLAINILSITYGLAALFSKITGRRGKKNWTHVGKILVIGTFHNPNWFHAHIGPLSKCGIGEIILVCDEPVEQIPNVIFKCPPKILSKLFSRAIAKFIWAIACGIKYKPDFYMGYHIFPAAISALVAARIFNRPACYQCTSGPLELEGGGWHAENRILVALNSTSLIVEHFLFRAIHEFDLIVVRGTKAQEFIRKHGFRRKIAIITGSVATQDNWLPFNKRSIDIAFVGRLTEYKRPSRFLEIVSQIAQKKPNINTIMIGEGPDRTQLEKKIAEFGIGDNVKLLGQRKDVPTLLSHSKIFLLTSRWEGLSIAMIEAMTAGSVPVVTDVGDLRDLVENGKTGFVIDENSTKEFSKKILLLINNPKTWENISLTAVDKAVGYSSINAISSRWLEELSSCLNIKE